MAIQKVGQFQINTSTGNQSITGLGFQPKLVIFFHNPDTVETGLTANHYGAFGMTDGTGQYAMWWFGPNGGALEDAGHVITDNFCIIGGQNKSNIYGASIVSLDSDGFTINVENPDVTPPDTWTIGYLAIGGNEVSAKVGDFVLNTGVGAQAVTGVGFEPTGMIFASLGNTSAFYTTGNGLEGNVYPTIGFSDGTNDACQGGYLRDTGVSVTLRARVQRNDSVLACPNGSSSYNLRASLTSLDADGFTLNVDDAGLAAKVFYAAVSGLEVNVGTILHDVTVGTYTAVSGLSFTPYSILQVCSNDTFINQIDGGGNSGAMLYSIGASDNDLNAHCIGGIDDDNVLTSDADHWSDENDLFVIYNAAGTKVQEAQISSFNSDGFDIQTLTGTGGDRYMGYIAFEGAEFDPGGGNTGTGSGGANSKDSSFFYLLV